MQGSRNLFSLNPSYRILCWLGFSYCAFIIITALFLEHWFDIEPCPLCMLQRAVVILAGILFILAGVFQPKEIFRDIYSISIIIMGILGVVLAGRQVWLENLPPELVPSCSAGLQRLFEYYPALKVFQMVFAGTGECAEVQFEIFGFSIASWSIVSFIVLIIFAGYLFLGHKKRWI